MTLFDPMEVGPAAAPGPLVRVRMTVAYDGRGFHGFAANTGVRTVAGMLGAALSRVLGHSVELAGAGRTDAGVHARGQVVSFDARADGLDLERLEKAVNALCGPAIAVRETAMVDDGFDARHSARSRTYRYSVFNSPVPDPFVAGTAWHVEAPLDLDLMVLACDPLIGEHDFSAFCRRPKVAAGAEPASLVRRVTAAQWEDAGGGVLWFWITANAFCHQMVRSIVGTLVEVGALRKRAGDVAGILRSGDRRYAGNLAPPHGLCLWHVAY